jgi:hypothetical protein
MNRQHSFFAKAPDAGPKANRMMRWLGLAAVALVFAASGCATVNPLQPQTPQQKAQNIEPMLQAAGFQPLTATTPEQKARLAKLPPLELNYYVKDGSPRYWLADPEVCGCLFYGDEADYQRFENIKLENERAEADREAIESQRQQMMMGPPGLFGPGIGFGGGGMGFGFGGGGIGFSF